MNIEKLIMRNLKIMMIVMSLALVMPIVSVARRRRPACKRHMSSDSQQSTTASILRSRGFIAQEHYVRVQDDKYTLSLIRATNPLNKNGEAGLPDKDPLLFIHGLMANANSFILINDKVKPKNYSNYTINSMTDKELEKLLERDQGSNSLVFSALNFGYEVWLLNRRPTIESRLVHALHGKQSFQRIDYDSDRSDRYSSKNLTRLFGLSSYWDFSFDEQARYDVPQTIDYVLEKSNRNKLVVVGHSAGTTLTFMALTEKPELADKISKAILWAPVLDMGKGILPGMIDNLLLAALPLTSRTLAPAPSPSLLAWITSTVYLTCRFPFVNHLYCYPWLDKTLGKGTSQLQIKHLNLRGHWADTGSKFEQAHYYQSLKKVRMHYYDYMDHDRNMKAYNQPEPPIYNISRIKLNSMSLWFGHTDQLARLDNFELTRERLTVPIKEKHIGGSGILFNHLGHLMHDDVRRLLIIPTLKTIESD